MASFKEAFAKARKDKKQTFEWNGKSYNTKLKGEDDGGKSTTRPKARAEKPQKTVISATSPRAPESTSRPKARADRGTGAVTRSARPAAKPGKKDMTGAARPTRIASNSRPQAETPTDKDAGSTSRNTPKAPSNRQANKDRAMQTYKGTPPKAKSGTKVKQTARQGRNPFLDFFKLGKGGFSDRKD